MSRRLFVAAVAALFVQSAGAEPPLFTDAFPASEFVERRARVMQRLGDAVAILQGATEYAAYVKFRQNNHFFYLTGVEVPRAILVIDGRARSYTLFLPPRDERLERSEGPMLGPDADAARLTGIESVKARGEFAEVVAALARDRRVVYTPFRPETVGAGTPRHATAHAKLTKDDPWDRRPSRPEAFMAAITAAAPGVAFRDLDPVLDEMRVIKSPREIALVREATRIAGLAVMEAMRSAAPGMYEYELEAIADYVFKRHNAQGIGYFALIAAGRNAYYPHYHASQSRLEPNDLVLFDYAPDFKYYTSDVTREFPAAGRFDASQRELYGLYLRLYRALMQSIRPQVAPRDVIRVALQKMDAIVGSYPFTSPKYREAAARFVNAYRHGQGDSLGHYVGMEVHDVAVPFDVLEPGMIFTIEPALTIPAERVYVRLEDVILITETGYENLSGFVPVDIEGIETLMAEEGMTDRDGARRTSRAGRPD
ncbi:MAG: aminopeptidase P family protein [Acidobacteria bacterium]|nr:aminopeptidase P family protein [Acidobacteriota bacterium]